jgi:iron complex outermembrane receptor protein
MRVIGNHLTVLGRLCWMPAAAISLISADAAAQAAGDASTTLPELRIEGESARGPVRGPVATRSATATRTDTPLNETPQSVTVVTRDRMDTLNATSLGIATRYTAGTNIEQFGEDARGEYFNIRGFPADIFLDGMRLPSFTGFGGFRLEPWGMERIEVLRGSSSALYGQSNLGGIINAVSRIPQPDQRNTVALQLGSFERLQGQFDLGGALTGDGSILWRLTGLVRDANTQIDDVLNNRIYLAPSIRFRMGDHTDLTVLGSYMHDDAGSSAAFLPPQGTVMTSRYGTIPRERNSGEPGYDRYRRNQYALGYLLEHRPDSDWTLRQNFRYIYMDVDYRSIYPSGTGAAQMPAVRQAYRGEPITNAITVDNQAERRFTTGPIEHHVLFGLDYRWQFLQSRSGSLTGPAQGVPSLNLFNPVYGAGVPLPPITTNTNQALSQFGIYAQDQLRLDRWILTLSGRQDWAWSDTRNNNTGAHTTMNDNAFTGRVGVLYASAIGLSPYVSYSTSFLPTAGADFSGRNFEPTTGQQWEVGLKYQPEGRSSLFTMALYDLRQQNITTGDPLHPGYSIQTGEARSRGIELEANVALTDNWRVIAAYTYQEPEITRSNTPTLGHRPIATPNHSASLWSDYTFRVADGVTATLGGGVRYQGNTLGYNQTGSIYHVPSFTLFDAMARIDWQNWRLSINGSNLADKNYLAACSGPANCAYGVGRTVFATLAYSW